MVQGSANVETTTMLIRALSRHYIVPAVAVDSALSSSPSVPRAFDPPSIGGVGSVDGIGRPWVSGIKAIDAIIAMKHTPVTTVSVPIPPI